MKRFSLTLLGLLLLTGCNSAAPMRSDEVSRLEEKALNAYRYGDLLAAESYLHRLLAQQDNDAQGWLLLGNIQLRQQRLHAAQHAYEQAILRDDSLLLAHHNLALVYLRLATQTLINGQAHTSKRSPLLEALLRLQAPQLP
ncbi:MAG: hypothetical protein M1363_06255 [Gammaproteobacteria bacterium]|nr:hypothetical protein [Gammaproteobacteria bacterium]